MRILLIAYETPPIVSGQSPRWFYLANKSSSYPSLPIWPPPVIAPHAPKWRCRFHRAFETMVFKRVEAAVVTTEAASELFMNRHGLQDLREKFSCVTQGFPSRGEKSTHIGHRRSELLKIVSTGNFYEDFRLENGLQGALSRCEEAIEEYFWNRRVIKYARSIRRVAVILDGGN